MSITVPEVYAMFDRLRPEAAEFFGDPHILDVPFSVEPETDPEYIAEGSIGKTESSFPHRVAFNQNFLPFMDEDEVRYVLMHELTHVAVTTRESNFVNMLTGGHGPKWEKAVGEYTGFAYPTMSIRRLSEVPGLDLEGGTVGPTLDDDPSLWSDNGVADDAEEVDFLLKKLFG